MHRTKCGALIREVISSAFLEEIIEDIGESRYSLIIDESTDISDTKYLCICVRYFSQKSENMVTDYLGIIEVVETTAEELYKKLVDFLSDLTLNIKQLIGIATNGANNLCGKYNSVYSRLKEDVPELLLIKCICHSLHLCTSKASETLPAELDFMEQETSKWFSRSPLRKAKYRQIFKIINDGNVPLNITKLSKTRWLSRYEAVNRILNQYLELSTHFSIAAISEKCHTTKTLSEMYQNKFNYLLLTGLKPFLREVNSLNLYFQSDKVDFLKGQSDINNFVILTSTKILKTEAISSFDDPFEIINLLHDEKNFKDISTINLGHDFSVVASEVSDSQIIQAKIIMKQFLVKLLLEIEKRLPHNQDIFKKINNFNPKICLSQFRPNFSDLPLSILSSNVDLSDVEMQWDKLLLYDWKKQFKTGELPSDPIQFWAEVIKTKNGVDEPLFTKLGYFALQVLTLPVSNAVVERAFSFMNAIKSKPRNRLKTNSLDAIMRIRIHSNVANICCNNYIPTDSMLCKYTNNIYQVQKPLNPNFEEEEEDFDIDE